MHKQALTIREVTETYPVSRSKLYAEIRAGKLKTCKFGRRTIITATEAVRWWSAITGEAHQ